jgi:hypothetical protein
MRALSAYRARLAKGLGAALAAAALGASLLVRRPVTPDPAGATAATLTTVTAVLAEAAATTAMTTTTVVAGSKPSPEEPVDPAEYLRSGSKEPLVPPVLPIDVELAPGSVVTAEPLVPPVIEIPTNELAPGSVATGEPLVVKPPIVAK